MALVLTLSRVSCSHSDCFVDDLGGDVVEEVRKSGKEPEPFVCEIRGWPASEISESRVFRLGERDFSRVWDDGLDARMHEGCGKCAGKSASIVRSLF